METSGYSLFSVADHDMAHARRVIASAPTIKGNRAYRSIKLVMNGAMPSAFQAAEHDDDGHATPPAPEWMTNLRNQLSNNEQAWTGYTDGHWAVKATGPYEKLMEFPDCLEAHQLSHGGSIVLMGSPRWHNKKLRIIRITQGSAALYSPFMAELVAISIAAILTNGLPIYLHSDCESAVALVKQGKSGLRMLTKHAGFNLLRICALTDVGQRISWQSSHPERRKDHHPVFWNNDEWGIFFADKAADPSAATIVQHIPQPAGSQAVIENIAMDEALRYLTSLLDWAWIDDEEIMLLEAPEDRYDRWLRRKYLSQRDGDRLGRGQPAFWSYTYHGQAAKQFDQCGGLSLAGVAQGTRISYDKYGHAANLAKGDINSIPTCGLCQHQLQDMPHLLLQCPHNKLALIREEYHKQASEMIAATTSAASRSLLQCTHQMANNDANAGRVWQGMWTPDMLQDLQLRHDYELENLPKAVQEQAKGAFLNYCKLIGRFARQLMSTASAAMHSANSVPALHRRFARPNGRRGPHIVRRGTPRATGGRSRVGSGRIRVAAPSEPRASTSLSQGSTRQRSIRSFLVPRPPADIFASTALSSDLVRGRQTQ